MPIILWTIGWSASLSATEGVEVYTLPEPTKRFTESMPAAIVFDVIRFKIGF